MRKPYQLPGWTKNSSYCIVPRSGIELTTSRLHSFIVAKVSHALIHSAMEAELTTSRLRSFIMAEVSHALNHLTMEAELTTSRLHSFIMAKVSHALNHSAMAHRGWSYAEFR